ncbi:MAG: hypothetical protein H6Q13_2085 [Bacteroidetes bacterium]|nr:hypothetical protein [Bacteroidota bacterium]
MKKYLFVLFLILPSLLLGQESISIGNKYSIYSSILKEKRSYWVYLPPEYDNNAYGKASYPVIFLLDGDTNFTTLVAIQQAFTKGMYNNMPQCIIVGIPNTDRTRDLTPSKAYLKHNGKEMFTNSGGSELFTSFLLHELKSKIDSTYRTNGYNILIGHSFGGLFTINTLLHHADAFNAYIALDPSLWWDSRKVYKEAESVWESRNFSNKSLYVAMAKNQDKPNDEQKHSATIRDFCTIVLPSAPNNKLNAAWKYYENEDHGTVIVPAIFDALRNLFQGIELPVKKIPETPDLIPEYYKKLSVRLGHSFVPDEVLVDNIGKYALSIGNIEGAIKIFEYNYMPFAHSKNARESLVNAYLANDNKEKAALIK